MTEVNFTDAAAAVQELASRVNLYVEESAPWKISAKSEETQGELAFVLYNALEACRILALFFAPFMPNTSAEVFRRLSLGAIEEVDDIKVASVWGQLPAGNAVEKGAPAVPASRREGNPAVIAQARFSRLSHESCLETGPWA